MTNKPMLSVERDLLERIAKPLKVMADKPYRTKAILELRALLDKPAYPNRLCHADYTTHPYICGCLKGDEEAQRRFDEHHSKGAQHHGEPVAIVTETHWDSLKGSSVTLHVVDASCLALGDKLYLRPPAPVAVVMPERQKVEDGEQYLQEDFVSGWNACLDAADRLNGVKP